MYARHLMVAVDGTKESERAVEFTVEHLCRSGDLLHLMHVSVDTPPLPTSTTGAPNIIAGLEPQIGTSHHIHTPAPPRSKSESSSSRASSSELGDPRLPSSDPLSKRGESYDWHESPLRGWSSTPNVWSDVSDADAPPAPPEGGLWETRPMYDDTWAPNWLRQSRVRRPLVVARDV